MKVALIGFGELGHYLRDVLDDFHAVDWSESAFFDDVMHGRGEPNAFPFGSYAEERFSAHRFYICLGYKHLATKAKIISRLVELGREVPSIVHPSSYVHPTVKLGPGVFVYPGVSIDRNTVIGAGSWIANGDVIAHDCAIGEACWFGASVTLSGKVTVESRTFIGSGSTVSNDVKVGSDVIVGLATSVTKHVADGRSVIGNPMRVLEKRINLI